MRLGYLPTLRRFNAPASLILIVLFLVFFFRFSGDGYLRPVHGSSPGHRAGSNTSPAPPRAGLPELQAVLGDGSSWASESEYCRDRFGPKYLEDLRDHAIQYCSDFSPSGSLSTPSLTCFHSHTASNADRDSFCVGHGAVLEPSGKAFALPCQIRTPTAEEQARGLIHFGALKRYWYATGPAVIFENYFRFNTDAAKEDWYPSGGDDSQPERPPFVVMIKREGEGNVWHSLMEIWSLTMSLDVLRLSPDVSRRGNAFFEAPGDVPNAQVVILDGHRDGPFFSLWKLLTGHEPLRWAQWVEQQKKQESPAAGGTPQTYNVIVPLPGGSNPQWQNDWTDRDCQDNPLLKVFARRVMDHYGIEEFRPVKKSRAEGGKEPLSLTFLDRRGSRRLVDTEELIAAAKKKFPDVEIQSLDFAGIPFPEQIRIVRETDILVGVHGAGLTHTMFLIEGGAPDSLSKSAAVVEYLPEGMDYKGFRNMAQMMGHRYFSTHAQVVPAGTANEEEKKKKKPADAAAKPAGTTDGDVSSEGAGAGVDAKKLLHKRDDWHSADVKIAENEFLDLIASAIAAIQ